MKDLLLLHQRIQSSRGNGYGRRPNHNSQRGILKEGSSTDRVLAVIAQESPRAVGHAEIVRKSECPPGQVKWALYYLCSIGKIRSQSALDPRSPLYLRYVLVVDVERDNLS